MQIQYATYTTSGIYKAVNEDNFYMNGIIKSLSRANCSMRGKTKIFPALFAVCDGLGGETCGEEAAFTAVSAIKDYQKSFDEKYTEYIGNVNKSLQQHQKIVGCRMGCTLAALYINEEKCLVVNLGDSRVYRYRERELEVLTKDHTEFSTMLQYGLLKEEDYYTSNTRNSLTRCLGNDAEESEPHICMSACKKGDVYLICSDGFCGTIKFRDIKSLLDEKGSLLSKCKKMVKSAINRGTTDNVTVMLISVNE